MEYGFYDFRDGRVKDYWDNELIPGKYESQEEAKDYIQDNSLCIELDGDDD